MPEPTFEEIADEFCDALVAALPTWLERRAREIASAQGTPLTESASEALRRVARATAAEMATAVQPAVRSDVDAGAGSPLAAIRDRVGPMSRFLGEQGVVAPERDPFDVAHFPDDSFGLGPASFGEIDPALEHPGLVWGAARAHVHLSRRRQ